MAPGLRELKKQRTRAAIQQAAVALIDRQGYDATTCEQIAAAAEVSPATFFRYFPTKEDVVLTDDYDPLIAAAIGSRPARERPLVAVRRGLAATFASVDEAEMVLVRSRTALLLSVPALRVRVNEQLESARAAFAAALAPRMDRPADSLEVQAFCAALAAALGAAVERWAATPDADDADLAVLVDEAMGALAGR